MTAVAAAFARARPDTRTARVAAFALVAAAGLALRVWIDRAAVGIPDSDEAIVGLMVRHALHGELTTFYWGQPYGGSQEALLTVPLFAVFGAGYTALRVVPIVLSGVAAFLVWRVGRRTLPGSAPALAGALMWLWFPESLVHLTHQYDFYASEVLYAALLLLLVLRVVERPTALRVGILGLTLGLAFWQSVQVVPIVLPALVWAAWKQPRALRHAWLGGVLAVVGALPWLIWNLRHDWGSLMDRADLHQYAHSLRLFASPLLPMTLGLRTPLTGQLLLPSKVVVTLLYAALLVLAAIGAVRYRHRRVAVLFLVFFLFPFIWAIAKRVTYLSAKPTYLIVLTPVIALLVALLGRRPLAAVAIAAAALAISAVSIQRMDDDTKAFHPRGIPVVPRDLGPLVAVLDRAGIDHVYADYWITYRLAFDTRERIVATEVDPGGSSIRNGVVRRPKDQIPRQPAYARAVDESPRRGFVFFRRSAGLALPRQLVALGYRRVLTGGFAVYLPPLT